MKKSLIFIVNFILWLVVFAIILFIFLAGVIFNEGECSLFGYKGYIVLSDSMKTVDGDESKGYFASGDLIICKSVNPQTLVEGDVITFNSSSGKTITHKIKRRVVDDNGNDGFITYGTSTGVEDEEIVLYSQVLGKFKKKLVKIDEVYKFFKSPSGYFLFIFIPFAILIAICIKSVITLFLQLKEENSILK